MPPPQQLLSSAVSTFVTKWLNVVLVIFLIVALPLSTPSASTTQKSSTKPSSPKPHPQGFPTSQEDPQQPLGKSVSFCSLNYKEDPPRTEWPHWKIRSEEVCSAARDWTKCPGSFCQTLWNSPYLKNRTELEAREERAVDFFCEMDRILDRFDCAQEYSVNVRRKQCKLCRDAYREWACAMITDTMDDGQIDCETKLMPCPSCASICHQVMRLCPYLSPDRLQTDKLGKLSPQVSQYGGHPAFYCPLENDDPSDPAYTSLCYKQSIFSPHVDSDLEEICTSRRGIQQDYYYRQTHHKHLQKRQHPQHHHFTHPDKNNNDKISPYPPDSYPTGSSSSKKHNANRFSRDSRSSSSTTSSKSSSSHRQQQSVKKGQRDLSRESVHGQNSGSKPNNNKYYDSEDPTSANTDNDRNSANYLNDEVSYSSGESFNSNFNYHEEESGYYGGSGSDDYPTTSPSYFTSCCWTYASSIVQFTSTKAYPDYNSDKYFAVVTEPPPEVFSKVYSNSLVNSSSSSLYNVSRKPSISKDNHVILNCCDSHGKCTSNDPESETDDKTDLEDLDASTTYSPYEAEDEEYLSIVNPALNKLKSSQKRSSETTGHNPSGPKGNNIPVKEEEFDTKPAPDGSKPLRHKEKEEGRVTDTFQSDSSSPVQNFNQNNHQPDIHQRDSLLPNPTHIPTAAFDYLDEHYLDTEPDGDGGSSSTELEVDDDDAFDPGFRPEWYKVRSTIKNPRDYASSHNTAVDGAIDTEDPATFQFNLHHKPVLQQQQDLALSNGFQNNHKNKDDNNKLQINFNKHGDDERDSRARKGGSSSNSVQYQKKAFMAIVIGGDDVDRHHSNLVTNSEELTNSRLNFNSKLASSSSSDIHFTSYDLPPEGHTDREESYYARVSSEHSSQTPPKVSKPSKHLKNERGTLNRLQLVSNPVPSSGKSSYKIGPSPIQLLTTTLHYLFQSPPVDSLFLQPSTIGTLPTFASVRLSETPYSSENRLSKTFDSWSHPLLLFFLLLLSMTNFLPIILLSMGYDDFGSVQLKPKKKKCIRSSHAVADASTKTIFTARKVASPETTSFWTNFARINQAKLSGKEEIGSGQPKDPSDHPEELRYYDDIRNPSREDGVDVLRTYNYTTYFYNYHNKYNSRRCSTRWRAKDTDSRYQQCDCCKNYYKSCCHKQEGLLGEKPSERLFRKSHRRNNPPLKKPVEFPKGGQEDTKSSFHLRPQPPSSSRLLTAFIVSRRNFEKEKRDSRSNGLVLLLYYKVIKFLLILKSRTSDTFSIIIMSVQHKSTSTNSTTNNTTTTTTLSKGILAGFKVFFKLLVTSRSRAVPRAVGLTRSSSPTTTAPRSSSFWCVFICNMYSSNHRRSWLFVKWLRSGPSLLLVVLNDNYININHDYCSGIELLEKLSLWVQAKGKESLGSHSVLAITSGMPYFSIFHVKTFPAKTLTHYCCSCGEKSFVVVVVVLVSLQSNVFLIVGIIITTPAGVELSPGESSLHQEYLMVVAKCLAVVVVGGRVLRSRSLRVGSCMNDPSDNDRKSKSITTVNATTTSTTNYCTMNWKEMIKYYNKYNYTYYKNYSIRLSREVTIINKIIKFVVQYNDDHEQDVVPVRLFDGKIKLDFNSSQRAVHSLSEETLLKEYCRSCYYYYSIFRSNSFNRQSNSTTDEFPTKSYSNFIEILELNYIYFRDIELSVISWLGNQQYHCYCDDDTTAFLEAIIPWLCCCREALPCNKIPGSLNVNGSSTSPPSLVILQLSPFVKRIKLWLKCEKSPPSSPQKILCSYNNSINSNADEYDDTSTVTTIVAVELEGCYEHVAVCDGSGKCYNYCWHFDDCCGYYYYYYYYSCSYWESVESVTGKDYDEIMNGLTMPGWFTTGFLTMNTLVLLFSAIPGPYEKRNVVTEELLLRCELLDSINDISYFRKSKSNALFLLRRRCFCHRLCYCCPFCLNLQGLFLNFTKVIQFSSFKTGQGGQIPGQSRVSLTNTRPTTTLVKVKINANAITTKSTNTSTNPNAIKITITNTRTYNSKNLECILREIDNNYEVCKAKLLLKLPLVLCKARCSLSKSTWWSDTKSLISREYSNQLTGNYSRLNALSLTHARRKGFKELIELRLLQLLLLKMDSLPSDFVKKLPQGSAFYLINFTNHRYTTFNSRLGQTCKFLRSKYSCSDSLNRFLLTFPST